MELGIAIGHLNSHDSRGNPACGHVFYPTLEEAVAAHRKRIESNIKSHERSATDSCTELANFDEWINPKEQP